METVQIQKMVVETCEKHGWPFNPFEDMTRLTEEVGELAREVRRLEVGRERPDEDDTARFLHRDALVDHLAEEAGDILFSLTKILHNYGTTLEYAYKMHHKKMETRYAAQQLAEMTTRKDDTV